MKAVGTLILVIVAAISSAQAGQQGTLSLSGRVPVPTYDLFSENGGYRVVPASPAYRVYISRWQSTRMPASQVWSEAQVVPRKEWKRLKTARRLTTSSYIRIVAP